VAGTTGRQRVALASVCGLFGAGEGSRGNISFGYFGMLFCLFLPFFLLKLSTHHTMASPQKRKQCDMADALAGRITRLDKIIARFQFAHDNCSFENLDELMAEYKAAMQ
jgi:hypothetical protein